MANLSYLFLGDREPAPVGTGKNAAMRHIGTGRHTLPFAFKLLLSGEPKAVRNADSASPHRFYLVSPREPGLARLRRFLGRIELPGSRPLIEQTLAFLDRPAHRLPVVIADPWDIFDPGSIPLSQQFRALHQEILDIESAIDAQLERIHAPLPLMTVPETQQPGLVARLFGARPTPPRVLPFPDPLYRLEQIGLRSWHEDRRYPPEPGPA